MDLGLVLRALHIVAAVLWFGGAAFMAFVLGPSMAKAGPAAGPFMAVVLRRGGFSPFFMTTGAITLLAGGYAYGKMDLTGGPFGTTQATLLTVGAIIAVLVYLDGLFMLMPNERRMKRLVLSMPAKGPPPAETLASLQKMGEKQGKTSALSTAVLGIALLCMVLARVLA